MKENTVCLSLEIYTTLINSNKELHEERLKYKELALKYSNKYYNIKKEYFHLIGIIKNGCDTHLYSYYLNQNKICDYINNSKDRINML